MLEFDRLSLPFRWYPELLEGQTIKYADIKISVYPSYLPIWDSTYYAQPIYLYFLEGEPPRVIAQRYRLSFYHNRIYPPAGSKPIGVYCWASNQQMHLSGSVATV